MFKKGGDLDEVKQPRFIHELNEPEVVLNEDFSNVIVVDGMPIVSEEKHAKLVDVMKKWFVPYGDLVDVYIPLEGEPGKRMSLG